LIGLEWLKRQSIVKDECDAILKDFTGLKGFKTELLSLTKTIVDRPHF